MANQDDNNNQEIEKVEDVEVETTKNTSDTDNKKQNNGKHEDLGRCRKSTAFTDPGRNFS